MAYPINIQIKSVKRLSEYQGQNWYVRQLLYSFRYTNSMWRSSDIYRQEEHVYLCNSAFIRLCPLPLPLARETLGATVANPSEGTRRISLTPLNIQRIISLCVLQTAGPTQRPDLTNICLNNVAVILQRSGVQRGSA